MMDKEDFYAMIVDGFACGLAFVALMLLIVIVWAGG